MAYSIKGTQFHSHSQDAGYGVSTLLDTTTSTTASRLAGAGKTKPTEIKPIFKFDWLVVVTWPQPNHRGGWDMYETDGLLMTTTASERHADWYDWRWSQVLKLVVCSLAHPYTFLQDICLLRFSSFLLANLFIKVILLILIKLSIKDSITQWNWVHKIVVSMKLSVDGREEDSDPLVKEKSSSREPVWQCWTEKMS